MSDINLDGLLPDLGNDDLNQTPANDGFELEIGPGKREKFTREQLTEFYKGHLRQDDYTRKTQEIAEQRRQLEANLPKIQQLYQERQALIELLEDEGKLNEYRGKRWPGQTPGQTPPAPDPHAEKIATLLKEVEHLKSQVGTQPERLLQQTRHDIETAQLEGKISAHLETIFEANPLLKAIDQAEDIIRFKVFNRGPKDLAEARQFFTEEAKAMVEKVSEHFKAPKKVNVPSGGAPKVRAIAPPGGAGSPAPQPISYKGKDGKVDWTKVDQMADLFLASYNKD